MAAADAGWQIEPEVCPDCLRWAAIEINRDSTPRSGRGGDFGVVRHGRFWAVYEGGSLLCVTVYRKGAEAVAARLQDRSAGEASHGSR